MDSYYSPRWTTPRTNDGASSHRASRLHKSSTGKHNPSGHSLRGVSGRASLHTADDEFGIMKSSRYPYADQKPKAHLSSGLSPTKGRRGSPYGQHALRTSNTRPSSQPSALRRRHSSSMTSVSRPRKVDPYNRKKRVRFKADTTVQFIPADHVWREARRGQWKAAPEDDELWDGYLQDFRPEELTKKEFESLQAYGTVVDNAAQGARHNVYDHDDMDDEEYLQHSWFANGVTQSNHAYDQHLQTLEPGDDLRNNDYVNSSDTFDTADASGFVSPSTYRDAFKDSSYSDSFGYLHVEQPPMYPPSQREAYKGCIYCIPMLEWSVDEVAEWLASILPGDSDTIHCFMEHGLDGDILFTADRRTLHSIGIKRRSLRKVILKERDEARQSEKFPLWSHRCSCRKRHSLDRLQHQVTDYEVFGSYPGQGAVRVCPREAPGTESPGYSWRSTRNNWTQDSHLGWYEEQPPAGSSTSLHRHKSEEHDYTIGRRNLKNSRRHQHTLGSYEQANRALSMYDQEHKSHDH